MTPADVDRTSSVPRTREQVIKARRRRQTYTFVSVFALVFATGLMALGNWQEWWVIGGSAQAASICPVQSFTEPRATYVNVVNGTARKGLAGAVAKELQKRQFKILTIENGDLKKPVSAVVEVRYGLVGKAAARTVAQQFPAKVQMVQDEREDESVDIVIGDKYKAMVAGAKAAAAIKLRDEPRGCVRATTPPTPKPSSA